MINDIYSKEKDILAVIEYGSHARGDNDESSDYDIFVLTRKLSINRNIQLKKRLGESIESVKYDLSIFDEETFNLMLKHGSLFLWHLKLEGKFIYQKNKKDLFKELKPFRGSEEDMYLYRRIFEASIKNIERNGINYYDLYMLSVLTRNSLIILCYKFGDPQFGRKTVYNSAAVLLDKALPIGIEIYNILIDYRFVYSRGILTRELPDLEAYRKLTAEVDALIKLVMDKLEIRNSMDRVASIIENRIDRNLYASYEISTEFERDLYTVLARICKTKADYSLNGLEEKHQELFKTNSPEFDDYNKVLQGFKIYNDFTTIKKETSTYGPDTSDIFKNQHFFNNLFLGEKFIGFLERSNLLDQIKKFNINGVTTLIEKYEKQLKANTFTKEIKAFSKNTRSYIEK